MDPGHTQAELNITEWSTVMIATPIITVDQNVRGQGAAPRHKTHLEAQGIRTIGRLTGAKIAHVLSLTLVNSRIEFRIVMIISICRFVLREK